MNKFNKKRLFFDIETSPNVGFFWSAGYKLNVPYSNIIKERAIICICYKWEGEDKVYSLQWDKDQNDKAMLEQFILVANEAHELVGHNGDRYDLPWIRTRCLFHGIPCFPNYTTIDTLKQALDNIPKESESESSKGGANSSPSSNSSSDKTILLDPKELTGGKSNIIYVILM